MINAILKKLGLGDGSLNADIESRRHHVRYSGRGAEVLLGGQAYALRDWSLSGVAFDTQPDSRILVGDRVSMTLLFRFPHDTLRIETTGKVVRTGRRGTAALLPEEARRGLARVIDNVHAQDFLQSQVA